MQAIDFRAATAQSIVLPPQAPHFEQEDAAGRLHLRVLRTARDRQAIAGLRRHAAFGVENDLGLQLESFEQKRDEIGLLTATYRGPRLLATLRLVPTAHGLTGAERLLRKVDFDDSILGDGSWEIGRVIMEPEDRHPDLLVQCLRLTLAEVMAMEDVRDFHATTTLAMARLWRRVGMRTVLTTEGASGTRYCLVHGRVDAVAAALDLPVPEALGALAPQPFMVPAHAGRGAMAGARA
jgi:hypothetical protein